MQNHVHSAYALAQKIKEEKERELIIHKRNEELLGKIERVPQPIVAYLEKQNRLWHNQPQGKVLLMVIGAIIGAMVTVAATKLFGL